jgi:tetratricopeptide (TPR) repeat protein
MMTAHEILEKARAAGQRLPYNEAAVLFAAAVRVAAASDSTLRGRLLRIDDAGGLHLDTFDENAPEAEPAYLAPELLTPDAPDKTDPKVQVYAAGVLGYELLTGKLAPSPGQAPGPELSGDLGEVVRRSLSVDRRVRIEDLRELQQAVETVQPRPPAEGERNILSALRNRFSRPPPEKEALAKVIDRLHQLETQIAQLGKAQARLEAAQRESLEAIDRFEMGQHRTGVTAQRRPSVLAPALFGGVLASAAVIAGAWALGLLGGPGLSRAPATASSPEAAAPAQPPAPVPEPATPDAAVAAAEPTSAQIDAGAAAAAASDAGEADASFAATSDAGAPHLAAAPPATAEKKRPPVTTQTAMAHAVALTQIRRGEAALEQGNVDDALASFRSALDNEPTNPAAFRGLGMAYAMQGDDGQALQAYDRYLRLAPRASDAAEIRQSIRELKARAKSGESEEEPASPSSR